MNAKIARQIANNANIKADALNDARIKKAVNAVLDKSKVFAEKGNYSMLFSIEKLVYDSEIDVVKTRLKELGYSFADESGNGFKYEMICW